VNHGEATTDVAPPQVPSHWWQETWRRNLAIVWVASLLGSAAMTFAFPFVPLFLRDDLGVTNPRELAFWTGVIAASNGVTLIFASPLWGSVADRYGRKPMLIRALAGSGFFVGLMALCQAPWQVAATRFGLGAVTGILPTGSAMIASVTPRAHVGWALGMIWAAFAVGGAAGPLVASLLSGLMGLRWVFLVGGVILVVAAVLVALVMREARRDATAPRPHVMRELRSLPRPTIVAILLLLLCQCFLWMGLQSAQPMFALRILELAPDTAAAVTGIAFACAGVTSFAASVSYARVVKRVGYKRTAFGGLALASLAILAGATSSSIAILVASMTLMGLASGALQPIVSSMLGLEVPSSLVGTVFGLNNSALAVGIATGPFAIGVIAAQSTTAIGLGLAVVPLALMLLSLQVVKEPTA
jgi:DHA1 family multidrug resistance protein-like MFS transporter